MVIKQLGAIVMIYIFVALNFFLRVLLSFSFSHSLIYKRNKKSKPICSINDSFSLSPHFSTWYCILSITQKKNLLLIINKLTIKWNQSIYIYEWWWGERIIKRTAKWIIIIDFFQLYPTPHSIKIILEREMKLPTYSLLYYFHKNRM